MKLSIAFFLSCIALAFADQPFDLDSNSAIKILRESPLRVAKTVWKKGKLFQLRFENPREMESEALWNLLDWVGGEAGWIEIDFEGYLNPKAKSHIQGSKQAWFRQAPGARSLVATLKGKVSATIEITAAEGWKDVRQPLDCRYNGEVSIFRDFSPRNSELCGLSTSEKCLFVHQEDSRLSAETTTRSIRMLLKVPDSEPFPVVEFFSNLSDTQKEQSVLDYRSYFQHEFNLAVRSFVETVPGLFNWQVWQWMEWGSDSLIPNQEIRALLESGQQPGILNLFKASCMDGRSVKIWSDGQGTMGMNLL